VFSAWSVPKVYRGQLVIAEKSESRTRSRHGKESVEGSHVEC
jgi:hypothetical protein